MTRGREAEGLWAGTMALVSRPPRHNVRIRREIAFPVTEEMPRISAGGARLELYYHGAQNIYTPDVFSARRHLIPAESDGRSRPSRGEKHNVAYAGD